MFVSPCEVIGKEKPLVYVLEEKGIESFEDVSINPELPTEQKLELKKLMKKHAVIFTDKQGLTSLVRHAIQLNCEKSIREKQNSLLFSTIQPIQNKVQSSRIFV